MPISSLIVRTEKNRTDEVADRINDFKEITATKIVDENIVVITETHEQNKDKLLWKNLENIPGVLQCDLIYHNFEDEEELDHGK